MKDYSICFTRLLQKILIGLILIGLVVKSPAQDNLDLHELIGTVDSSDIFIQKDYYQWCSSVIKGDDRRYHMFYSRWPHGKRALADDSMNYIFDGFRGWNK